LIPRNSFQLSHLSTLRTIHTLLCRPASAQPALRILHFPAGDTANGNPSCRPADLRAARPRKRSIKTFRRLCAGQRSYSKRSIQPDFQLGLERRRVQACLPRSPTVRAGRF
jgi:hypothetical protein